MYCTPHVISAKLIDFGDNKENNIFNIIVCRIDRTNKNNVKKLTTMTISNSIHKIIYRSVSSCKKSEVLGGLLCVRSLHPELIRREITLTEL